MPEELDFDAHPSEARRLLGLLAVTAVRTSFDRCCRRFDEFFDTFYATLADRAPGVGAMFANVDMAKQNTLVHDGIGRLLEYAAHEPTAAAELDRLGRLHGRGGLDVGPELYPIWVDSLLHAVREYDPDFSEPLERAWREVLRPGLAVVISHYDAPRSQ